jgi:hypothetical protein
VRFSRSRNCWTSANPFFMKGSVANIIIAELMAPGIRPIEE